MGKDLDIFESLVSTKHEEDGQRNLPAFSWDRSQFIPPVHEYDRCLVFFSGGKDSIACVLFLLELGVSIDKIELHHHDVDGREGSSLMDWPVTRAYVDAFGIGFGAKVFYSWRQGGFEREMLRENCGTAPVTFTRGDGTLVSMGGDRSKASTRRMFPQVTANLSQRYCSSALKCDVGSRLLINDERFRDGKTLVITGERAQESSNRARYAQFEPDRADLRNGRIPRWIDHWRPVHSWSEEQIWACLKKWRVAAHPAYFAGWGRASCMKCIFGSRDQWATLREIDPFGVRTIANYEREFGKTIHRTLSVDQLADLGTCYPTAHEWKHLALSHTYDRSIFMDPWILPAGAFGEGCGPT